MFFGFNYYAFEEGKTLMMVLMQEFHNYVMIFLTLILVFLLSLIFMKLKSKFYSTKIMASQLLELVWTIFPMLILLLIALPSLYFLYLTDLSINPICTMKAFGAQWYWIYEYENLLNNKTSAIWSYMISNSELLNSSFHLSGWRLLEVDSRGILPYGVESRILVSSYDVIHSFSLPSMGIKIDAIPGRLNWISVFANFPGTNYGQCTEICGVGHSFMPIVIEFVSLKDFFNIVEEL
uniref:Cytochrome c oxidase subunit 2 n=1 Tax=Franklinothrips vespiformis TaxID=297892 RepID=A0A8A5LBG9_FRAVS|nr:cytochrome c oxidase subunit 2 [Franklinothrips vespiformis]